jgi:hypothetical protein
MDYVSVAGLTGPLEISNKPRKRAGFIFLTGESGQSLPLFINKNNALKKVI